MGSEVLIVVHEVGLVLLVDELTGLLYILGHSWRAAAEHPDLPHLSSVGGEGAVVAVLLYLRSIPAVGPDILLLYAQDFQCSQPMAKSKEAASVTLSSPPNHVTNP